VRCHGAYCRGLAHDALQFRADSSDPQNHPAMAAGVTNKLWEISDIVALLDQENSN